MRKNVASQVIGAQMTTAADGTNFTGAVTVYVTGDAGTQAAGSVGAGACTHEGKGFHTYAPAQAETNYNHVAFTFEGTGAITATVQVFTTSLNPHDTVRGGMTALPNAAADAAGGLPISDAGGLDMDALRADVAATLADTGTDGVVVASGSKTGYSLTATTGLGNQTADITGNLSGSVGSVTGAVGSVTGSVGSVTGAVGSVTGLTASDVGAIKTKTDSLTYTKALELDVNLQSVNGVTVNGDGAGTPMGV